MGLLVDGKWQDKWYDTSKTGGRFERSQSQWRDFVTADGGKPKGARAASRPSPVATISTSRWPARGRTGR